ncbi:MAG TPA: tetratricopeptide repeat protein [Chloroflexota bacterium]|nr:tetratricopeptide repeat protein [Chloroflexota bacterium]
MPRQPAPHGEEAFVSSAAGLTIRLLGGFEVRVGQQLVPESAWRLNKARSLLKLLALAPAHRLPRDSVIDQLWPDLDPGPASNNLHQTLHGLRRALSTPDGSPRVRLQHGIIELALPGPLLVDVAEFEAAAARARHSDEPAAYHAAIDLYAGDLLPDDLYEDWAAGRREALRQTYLGLLLGLARRHEARGELRQAMEALRRAVECEPSLEEAHAQLMRLYAATGQRGRALRQYEQLREVLTTELNVEPDDSSRQLHGRILTGGSADPPDPAAPGRHAPIHNLPIALTSFVGRESEIARVAETLQTARLVTLAGIGGAGKTRLALRAGWDRLSHYRDGVWRVGLAALSRGELVPETIRTALQLAEQPGRSSLDTLREHLRSRHLLLILDNCEHLTAACAELAISLLHSCAELQILATSRARLGVPGEVTILVSPLSTPPASEKVLDDLARYESVRLFVERARSRRPDFVLAAENAVPVAQICRTVDGIPLAVELAAARAGVLPVHQIADRLVGAIDLLVTDDRVEARHQTLRAALDWSYQLLNPDERCLLRHLAVFEGGWSLEAAENVCDGENDQRVLDLLSGLVDKSLVVVAGTVGDIVRYRFLEPVRQYAVQRLAATGETAHLQRRHAAWFATLTEQAAPHLQQPEMRGWLDRLEADHDNLRAAMQWSLTEAEPGVGLRIAGAGWRFWFARGHLTEVRAYLDRCLHLARAGRGVAAPVLALARNAAGACAYFQSDLEEATKHYESALALYRELNDEAGMARVLSNLGLIRKDRRESERATELLEEALELQTRHDNRAGMASTLGNLGILAQETGDYERARALHERALALARETGLQQVVLTSINNLGAIAVEQEQLPRAREILLEGLDLAATLGVQRSWMAAATNLANIARKQGNFDEALGRYRSSLKAARKLDSQLSIALNLEGIAAAFAARHLLQGAVYLFAAADRLRRASGIPPIPIEQSEYDALLGLAHTRLGDEFVSAWNAGQRVAIDEVIAFASDEPAAGSLAPRSD